MLQSVSSPRKSPRGILLVGHGTRDASGTRQFFELADSLQQLISSRQSGTQVEVSSQNHQGTQPPILVQPALLEFQSPTISEGWKSLVESGVTHIDVVPLLLFAAGHAKNDIPDEISKAASLTPGVSYAFARPLSRQGDIVQLILRRVSECAGWNPPEHTRSIESTKVGPQTAREHRSIELVMIGRGSHDPCARSDMLVLSEMIRHRLGLHRVSVCFYAMTQPRFSDFLEANSPHHSDSLWLFYPHLLFHGRLLDSISEQISGWSKKHGAENVRLCSPLGPDPLVASAVLHRALQASSSAHQGPSSHLENSTTFTGAELSKHG